MEWKELIPESEITDTVTEKTVDFAQKFGDYLGSDDNEWHRLTTNQLRKFFGEVKRLQMKGYKDNKTDFILLKPKLAYAVGRDKQKTKIYDFYRVISDAIDKVSDENSFNNFIRIFEAIVAYHKAAESGFKLN